MVDFLLFSSKEKRNKEKTWSLLQPKESLENRKFTLCENFPLGHFLLATHKANFSSFCLKIE